MKIDNPRKIKGSFEIKVSIRTKYLLKDFHFETFRPLKIIIKMK